MIMSNYHIVYIYLTIDIIDPLQVYSTYDLISSQVKGAHISN